MMASQMENIFQGVACGVQPSLWLSVAVLEVSNTCHVASPKGCPVSSQAPQGGTGQAWGRGRAGEEGVGPGMRP